MGTRSTAPAEVDGGIIQVLRAKTAHQITVGAASARNTVAFASDSRVIEIYSDVACYFQTGDVTITASATDHYLPAQQARVYSLGGDKQAQHTHIAAIQASTGGTLYISELE